MVLSATACVYPFNMQKAFLKSTVKFAVEGSFKPVAQELVVPLTLSFLSFPQGRGHAVFRH